ncbi:MAG TPA: HAD-IIIC family phosphatase [Pseudolabrys sp.]|nr:HAD-IIIC family phosphatase [Pseudolabrys sp.]
MKFLLLSNVNVQPLVSTLKPFEVVSGAYNSMLSELSIAGSRASAGDISHVLCIFDGDSLIGDAFYGAGDADQCRMFLAALEQFCSRHPDKIVVANSFCFSSSRWLSFADLTHADSIKSLEAALNQRLIAIAKEHSNLVIFDMELLFRRHGEDALISNALWYAGRIRYTARMFELLGGVIRGALAAHAQQSRKVLILDLDNTLWGGIVGEAGCHGIALGDDGAARCYRDFQRSLKALQRTGVLLVIASKNNEADVDEVFASNPSMILKREDFAAICANWRPKVENISEIARVLNLGTESFVFIDDNPVEREAVRKFMPEVAVPEFPERVENLPTWFLREVVPACFGKYAITAEDSAKTEQYRANAARKKLAQSFDLDGYLAELGIECNIRVNSGNDLVRAAQMTQKTNQFNLTTRRYTVADLARFVESNEHAVLMLDYRDRFGDEGSVGLAIVDLGQGQIDTFLASCRVIGRKVEDQLLDKAIQLCRGRGFNRIVGEYIPTRKNEIVASFYEDHGFKLVERHPNGSITYEKPIDAG